MPSVFPILWQHPLDETREFKAMGLPREVPWAFIEPARKQAEMNHGQTLERLAQRGGLSPSEMLAALEGRNLAFVGRTPLPDARELNRLIVKAAHAAERR